MKEKITPNSVGADYLSPNSPLERKKAIAVLTKAKLQDEDKIKRGKQWKQLDNRTWVLR